MSDEERDVDIESDDEDEESSAGSSQLTQVRNNENADKRAHHNALERKRRDHIKDSFHSLRDSVPDLQGEKVSRAQILKKAAEYIQAMRDKNVCNQKDVEAMKKTNRHIESQIQFLENFPDSADKLPGFSDDSIRSDLSDDEEQNRSRRKRQKVSADS